MVAAPELDRRGLRHAVIVNAAVAQATLDDLDRRGLRYRVEVADGVSSADRADLERRGLRYFVPVLVDATSASRASLDRQGLRYAVQVDADIARTDEILWSGRACAISWRWTVLAIPSRREVVLLVVQRC